MKKLSIGVAVIALALVGLSGCANPAPDAGSGGQTGDTGDTGGRYGDGDTGGSTTGISTLTTAESDLGTIIVDDEGLTVYVFDEDTQGSGESSCSGSCLANWP